MGDTSKKPSMFQGMSLLRAEEKKREQAAAPKVNTALQQYLKKYEDPGADGSKPKVKKKKPKGSGSGSAAIKIIDEDVLGASSVRKPPSFATGMAEEDERAMGPLGEDGDEEDGDQPVIANEAEARALVKQVEKAKNYYARGQDGSGWTQADAHEAAAAAAANARSSRPRHDSPDASPPRRPTARHDSPDVSPPRHPTACHDSPDASPSRRPTTRHDSPDASPPRRPTARHDSPDASPPRRPTARHDSPDASPPRRRPTARHDSPDASPPRRGRHNSLDASPSRRPPSARQGIPDASPPRRRPASSHHDSRDASPPRRQPAARPNSPNASPPRKRPAARHDTPDASPPRRRPAARHDSPDASPPRRPADGVPSVADRKRAHAEAGTSGMPPPKQPCTGPAGLPSRSGPRMADGTATGLVTGKELQAEMASLQKEMEHKRKTAVGRGAETVYRDPVTGKIVDKETFAESRQRAGKRKPEKTKEELEQEQYLEWRSGLAQKRAADERAARMVEEANAPFARYEDDSERDALLRQQTRFGDPMANAVRSKRKDGTAASAVTERYNAEKLKSSGFIIPQEIPPHSWIKRGVAAPSNRYDIRPGRHWDGVDRSNGFEREMFKYQNLRRVQEQEARMWSMSDM